MQSIRSFEHHMPLIDDSAYIDPYSQVIGQVEIAKDSSVWPGAVVRGDVNHITIGEATNIQDNSMLHVTHDGPYTPGGRPLIIGEGNTIGHQVCLHACTIENFCLVGIGSLILDDVTIESYTMVGAGSLVAPGKHLEGGYLWLGRPAKRVRKLTKQECAQLEYSAQHYVRLKERYKRMPR